MVCSTPILRRARLMAMPAAASQATCHPASLALIEMGIGCELIRVAVWVFAVWPLALGQAGGATTAPSGLVIRRGYASSSSVACWGFLGRPGLAHSLLSPPASAAGQGPSGAGGIEPWAS